jgi:hypothetical protein
MKIITAFLMFIASISGFSQADKNNITCNNIDGVYLTATDFISNTFSDSLCVDYKKNRLVIGWAGEVKLKEDSIKRVYKFDAVFGYTTLGKKYRLKKGVNGSYNYKGIFKVVDTNGLIIYNQKHVGHVGYRYFYSKGINGKIKLLRLRYLKKDFPNQKEFLTQVKNYRSDLWRKNKNQITKINELFGKYIQ